jgi:hypothetical protein
MQVWLDVINWAGRSSNRIHHVIGGFGSTKGNSKRLDNC